MSRSIMRKGTALGIIYIVLAQAVSLAAFAETEEGPAIYGEAYDKVVKENLMLKRQIEDLKKIPDSAHQQEGAASGSDTDKLNSMLAESNKKIEALKKELSNLKKELAEAKGQLKKMSLQKNNTQEKTVSSRNKKVSEIERDIPILKDKYRKLEQDKKKLADKEKEDIQKIKDLEIKVEDAELAGQNEKASFEAINQSIILELKDAKYKALTAQQEAESARTKVEEARRQADKERLDMHYNMAVIFDKNRMYEDAEREYFKCLKIRPDDAYVYYNLGILYDDKLHNDMKAAEHYHRFLELKPEGYDAAQVKKWLMRIEQEQNIGIEIQ